MYVTLSGIFIDLRAVQSQKACIFIAVIPLGRITSSKLVYPKKALPAIAVIPSSITIFLAFLPSLYHGKLEFVYSLISPVPDKVRVFVDSSYFHVIFPS